MTRPAFLSAIGTIALLFGWLGSSRLTHSAEPEHGVSLADVTPTPTPEMWFYMHQLERQDDPKQAVRRKAIERAQQRRARMAASRWFGVYNLRPGVVPTPYTSNYWSETNANVSRAAVRHVTKLSAPAGESVVESTARQEPAGQTVRHKKPRWPLRLVQRKPDSRGSLRGPTQPE